MIKNVIFDIGGVIVKFKRDNYLDCFEFDEKTKNILINDVVFSKDFSLVSTGKMNIEDSIESSKKRHPELTKEIDMINDINNFKIMMPPHEQTLSLIKQLKQQGFKLYIISDIDEHMIAYLNQEIDGFEDFFDGISYSCRVGMVKKHGDVFDYVLEKYKLNPQETLFVDDVERNLAQAKLRGIQTLQFVSETESVNEIKKLLKQP